MYKYLFLIALFISSFTFAQRSYYKSFSTAEGLAQSQVTSICQDSIGYLWVGTLGGISRYNGNSFTNYSTDNGLLNNRVNSINYLNKSIYVGHQGGISIITGDKIKKYSLGIDKAMVNVTDILVYKNQIIVSTNGDGLYYLDKKTLVNIPILKGDQLFIRDLLVWEDQLYIATRGGIIRTTDLKKVDNFLPDYDVSISSLSIFKKQLLISTFYNGILTYNKQKNAIVNTKFDNSGNLLNHLLVDQQQTIWVSTSNGVIKYNSNKYSFHDNSSGLPFNVISVAFEDRDQNIWLGTQGKGLVKSSPIDISYYDKISGLPSDIVLSGFQSKDGYYYFGTMDIGVIQTRDFKTYKTIQTDPTVWCAIGDIDGKHWFGTKYGLYTYDRNGQLKHYNYQDGVPGFKITTFKKIDSKSMFIGGSHGIVIYTNGEFKPIAKNGDAIGTVRCIEQFNQQLIIGSDKGLFKFNNSTNEFDLIGQLNRTVFAFQKSKSNRLFMGTEDGLFELHANNSIHRIRYSQDVASNYINFINIHNEELIIGTNNGIYFVNTLSKNNNVRRIASSDGLIDPETNINSSFIDQNNALWFGTASALVTLNLESANRKIEHAKIKFDYALLNYERFNYTDYKAAIVNGIPQGMSFPYTKRNLQFNFDAVAVNNYDDLHFQYRLEGQDDNWMPPTKNPTIVLRSLPAGRYTLYARILFEDGSEIDHISIQFTIRQAFYYTWWFYTVLGLTLATIIYVLFRLRIKREQAKNELDRAEFKARLTTLEQQSLNASMNRHFIFNSLNSIQYFINISDKLSANKYLTSFARLIRKNLDSSTEEDGLVTLAEELERIKLYLSLESMRFQGKFVHTISTKQVDLESIKIPAMMIQPFVENSIIHGVLPQINKLGEINITIEEINKSVVIRIEDNGIGINKSIESKSNYTGDHKSQGMEITIKRIELIKKIYGQEMSIIGPLELQNESGEILGTLVEIKLVLNNLEN